VDTQNVSRFQRNRFADEIEKEIGADYPILSDYAAVALWTALEVLMQDFATAWICYKPAVVASRTNGNLGISTSTAQPELRAEIVELEAMRHIIAHNQSIVDARFKYRCPNVGRVAASCM
jgi:hypothetical protein